MSNRRGAWFSTGEGRQVVDPAELDQIPPYDPRTGDHLWVMTSAFRVEPATWVDPNHTPTLNAANLLAIVGPGCFYCEQLYSPRTAQRRCRGDGS